MASLNAELTAKSASTIRRQDARLYGRRDAHRYGEQIRLLFPHRLGQLCRQVFAERDWFQELASGFAAANLTVAK